MNEDRVARRPLVLVDIDGVVNAYAARAFGRYQHEAIAAGYVVVLDQRHPEWFAALAEHADLVWATMWQEHATTQFAPVAGFGQSWQHIPFDLHNQDSAEPSVQMVADVVGYKWRGVLAYAADRPLVYIDDDLTPWAHEWARSRDAAGTPTLFVQPDPAVGLTRRQYNQVLAFVVEHAQASAA